MKGRGTLANLAFVGMLLSNLLGCSKNAEEASVSFLSGTPAATGREETLYEFTPTSSISAVTYAIANKPNWAVFDEVTGKLSGFPDHGTYSDISIVGTANGANATVGPFTVTIEGDPLARFAWHLRNTGQTSFSVGSAVSGEDMNVGEVWRLGYTGAGVRIAVVDSGLELAHEDLTDNVLGGQSRNYNTVTKAPHLGNPTSSTTKGDHGTSVAGLIAAKGWNGKGGRGVASDAGIAGFNLISSSQDPAYLIDSVDGNFDIFNQSFGPNKNFYVAADTDYEEALLAGVTSLRSGKGAVYVKAAGNAFNVGSASGIIISRPNNFDGYNTNPYSIVVGAMAANGKKTSYSSTGSALWISGLGGEDGIDFPAMITTDQATCSVGYSPLRASYNNFEAGLNALNSSCNYTSTFNGTSSATPTISGVVALMLQAKPSLGWRDVKHILAATATKVDANIARVQRTIDATGYVYEEPWTTNAAGYPFHNWYGFGRADAQNAVKLALTYSPATSAFVETKDVSNPAIPPVWLFDSGTLTEAIPDNSSTGVSNLLNVTSNLIVEAVQIRVSITHAYAGDLAIELTSPSGTKSIVVNGWNASSASNYSDVTLLTNAFYGESSTGNWTIKVLDLRAVDSGTLTNWKINIAGHAP